MGSGNLRSDKHPDRADLPVEVAREFTVVEVDYLPQTPGDPELYEVMLGALMDQNRRIRVRGLPSEVLAPAYTDVVDVATSQKRKELDVDAGSGGVLWRFANFVADTQASYKGEANSLTPTEREASYLRAAVLDPGTALRWITAYRKSAARQGLSLQGFLGEKLSAWASQKTYPEEDRNLLQKFIAKFKLEVSANAAEGTYTILSPAEIGALSPRVPREPELLRDTPEPAEAIVYVSGAEVLYDPQTKEPASGSRFYRKGDLQKHLWVFRGNALGSGHGSVVLRERPGYSCLWSARLTSGETGRLPTSAPFLRSLRAETWCLTWQSTRAACEKFYRDHGLADFAASLPRDG